MKTPVRIIIMEPVTLLREGISLYIRTHFKDSVTIVAEVHSLYELRMVMMQCSFDVILTDLYGEQETLHHWWDFYSLFTLHWPEKYILAWTDIPAYYMRYFNPRTVMPYTFKKSIPLGELKQLLQQVVGGKCGLLKRPQLYSTATKRNFLTRQELLVINSLFRGETLSRIASRMGRSIKTVSCHKRNAMRKLGVKSNGMLLKLNKQMLYNEGGEQEGAWLSEQPR